MSKPTKPFRADCRKLWEDAHGKVLPGYEIHHIIPKHSGGKDVLENLEMVTKEEHQQRHLDLYHKFGDFRDLCAYHMIGYNFTEAHRITASEGGKIGGKQVYEDGTGIFRSESDRREWASAGGKVGGVVQRDNKLGIHGLSKEQMRENSSKGGKVGGFTRSDIQRENGKKGGPKNKGFTWVTDGTKTIKYSMRMQQEKSVAQFLIENPTFKQGRWSDGEIICPFCQKIGHSKPAMARHHFNNCKRKI